MRGRTVRQQQRSRSLDRLIALFDATVILLDPIVEVRVAPRHDLLAHCFTDRAWIGVMALGGHPLRRLPSNIQCSFEEAFRRVPIPMLTQHQVDEIAVSIDDAVEVLPRAADADICFIGMPRASSLALPLDTYLTVMRGAKRASHSRTASWVNSKPRSTSQPGHGG